MLQARCLRVIIKRKDSLGYVDFMRGKYSLDNINGILGMLNEMTLEERNNLLTKNFDEYFMWNHFNDYEKKEINSKLIDFGALKSYLVVNKKNLWKTLEKTPSNSIGRDWRW